MEVILLSPIRKEKITSGHAAEPLGKSINYVMDLMKDDGIAYFHY